MNVTLGHRMPHEGAEALGYYLYALRDPRDGEAFYIGKGTGGRVFAPAARILIDDHGAGLLTQPDETWSHSTSNCSMSD